MSEDPFVGRDDELEIAATWLRRAESGQAGVVWVEAPAGFGKSAFVREFLRRHGANVTTLRAEADDLATDRTFELIGQLGPVSSDEPFAAGLDLLARLGTRHGDAATVVVVEDFHWADSGSREALLTTARRLRDDRVLTLITTRPAAERDDGFARLLSDPSRGARISLGPLAAADVHVLAATHGHELDAAAVQRLLRHTNGHALYVRTLLNELSTAQLMTADSALPVPRSLAATTVARLTELDPAGRAIAQALAVLGERAPLSTVARIADVDDPLAAVEALLETNFVQWRPNGPHADIAFRHPLYRAAVEEDLAPTLRRRLHLSAAEALTGDRALLHRRVAANGPDQDLAESFRRAAMIAERTAEEASRFLVFAAELRSDPEERERDQLDALELLVAAGELRRATELAERAAGFATTPRRNHLLGRVAWRLGHAEEAEHALRAATGSDAGGYAHELQASALTDLALVYAATGRGAEAAATGERAIRLLDHGSVAERRAISTTAMGIGVLSGGAAGIDWLEQHLLERGAAYVEDPETTTIRGTLAYFSGRNATAVSDMRAAIARMPGHGQLPRAHLHLGQALVSTGKWHEALVQTHVALSLVADGDFPWLVTRVESAAATLYGYRGEVGPAVAHLGRALDAVAADNPESYFAARVAAASLARVAERWTDVLGELAPLTAAGEGALPMLAPLRWWQWMIEALIATGADPTEIGEQLDEFERGATRRRLELEGALLALRGQLALATGDLDSARTHFEQASARATADEPVLEALLRERSHGHVLAALGEHRAARDRWVATRAALAALGAAPFVTLLDSDLTAIGTPAPSRTRRSPLELTARESDVATLVTEGMTNREVAASLYVSEKAVEYHLGNIFSKLGIHSRRELRTALRH